jgi:dihydrofolate reductase
MISLIVATSKNGVIGKNGKIPWNIPADLAYFRKMTIGKTVIMGRKTFESIGKPLAGRRNIVISSEDINIKKVESFNGLPSSLFFSKEEIMIIGGQSIYKETIKYADRIYLTLVDVEIENGDIFFDPSIYENWKITSKEYHKSDNENQYNYSFIVLEK